MAGAGNREVARCGGGSHFVAGAVELLRWGFPLLEEVSYEMLVLKT